MPVRQTGVGVEQAPAEDDQPVAQGLAHAVADDPAAARTRRAGSHPAACLGLRVQAALAVKEGLDPDVALRAITLTPARVLGVDDRLGSLAPGKAATLCIWSGDPLDVRSRVEAAWIDGRQVLEAGGVPPVAQGS